jgi:hypothetical protein
VVRRSTGRPDDGKGRGDTVTDTNADTLGSGAMLYGPEHALRIAADAVGLHARSPEMAVGIILGIRACVEEYSRMIATPDFPPALDGKVPTIAPTDKTAELTRR